MSKRMLIDASRPQESRVVVMDGDTLKDADFETDAVKLVKGNVYLARVTRVEPSLQAVFVDYGGNRHGFLPLGEIHPDYFQVPISDREELVAEVEAQVQAWREEREASAPARQEAETDDETPTASEESETLETAQEQAAPLAAAELVTRLGQDDQDDEEEPSEETDADPALEAENSVPTEDEASDDTENDEPDPENESDESFSEEAFRNRAMARAILARRYRVQEVIKRRQVMLVQVSKDERGMKGAALTTFLSLAGRYCVFMPNSTSPGGISRRIPSLKDRRRLKTILRDLRVPAGTSLIVRTAGAQRTKLEIKRDYEFLLREWNDILARTLESFAPSLIHEEGSLLKRAIRDIYSRDMEEIWVEGAEAHKAAKALMKTLTPSHAVRVKLYKDTKQPLFQKYRVESQLDQLNTPRVPLKSGGYLVLGQTEALVAVDVNSGKSTSERSIEDTALRTNLEAAHEVARQLRLRDLAGLIVIDFIDMDEHKNRSKVERALKEAMAEDRARVQIGSISGFGLLELSRQRLRPSLAEVTTITCPLCLGTGVVRSATAEARGLLRQLEELMIRDDQPGRIAQVQAAPEVMSALLNELRDDLVRIETQREGKIIVRADTGRHASAYQVSLQDAEGNEVSALSIDPAAEQVSRPKRERGGRRGSARSEGERGRERNEEDSPASRDKTDTPSDEGKRRSRRRGGRGRRNAENDADTPELEASEPLTSEAERTDEDHTPLSATDTSGDSKRRRRGKRGKRGGRRRSKGEATDLNEALEASADRVRVESLFSPTPELAPEPEASPEPIEVEVEVEAAAKPGATSEVPEPEIQIRAVSEAPSTETETQTEAKPEAIQEAAPLQAEQTETQPASETQMAPEPAPEESEKPAKPRRRGWWNLV